MREILFRGKRVDNGEWVEGCIYYFNLESDPKLSIRTFIILVNGLISNENEFEVIPETVGQYTGLSDKNSNKIFEGDICRTNYHSDYHIGKVVYNNTTCGFEFWYNKIVGAYGEKATHKVLFCHCDNILVIGNIHDNPELLEGNNDR